MPRTFRQAATLVVVTTLLVAMGNPPAAAAVRRSGQRTLLVVVYDDTSQASVNELRAVLERSLKGNRRFRLLSRQAFVAKAKRLRVSPTRWFDADVLKNLTSGQGVEIALAARLARRDDRYRLFFTAIDPSTGKMLTQTDFDLSKPRLTSAQGANAIAALYRALSTRGAGEAKVAPEEEAVDEAPADETPAPADTTTEDDADSEWATDEDVAFDEVTPQSALPVSQLTLGGRVSAEHFSYPEPGPTGTPSTRDAVEMALEAKAGGGRASGFGRLLVRRNFTEPSRDRTDLEEGYGELSLGPATVRAGRLITSWGTASLFNPTDILNPVDMRDLIATEKLGTWMARVSVVAGPLYVEAYYLPVPEASLTPPLFEDPTVAPSRWPIPIELPESPLPFQLHLGSTSPPLPTEKHIQGALRVATSAAGFDASIGYAYLFDRMPTVIPTVQPVPPTHVDVTLDFTYPRIHAFTFDAETARGKWRFAAEGLAAITKDRRAKNDAVPDPYAMVVAGGDYRSAQFFTDHTVQVFAEVVHTRALRGTLGDDLAGRLRYPLRLDLLTRLVYEVGDRVQMELNWIEALDIRERVVNPKVSWNVAGRSKLQVAYWWLMGDEKDGVFALFRDNSRVTVLIETLF